MEVCSALIMNRLADLCAAHRTAHPPSRRRVFHLYDNLHGHEVRLPRQGDPKEKNEKGMNIIIKNFRLAWLGDSVLGHLLPLEAPMLQGKKLLL